MMSKRSPYAEAMLAWSLVLTPLILAILGYFVGLQLGNPVLWALIGVLVGTAIMFFNAYLVARRFKEKGA